MINGYDFICTCVVCPEQYDVFGNGKQVGYVRLRYGVLTLDYPNINGKEIYRFLYDNEWLGSFMSEEDRDFQFSVMSRIIEEYEKRSIEK